MDRETRIGFTCMFAMLFIAVAFPFVLKFSGAW